MLKVAPAAFCVLVAVLTASAAPSPGDHPSSLVLDVAVTVPRAAQARRSHLFGSVELYSLAIYLDGSLRDAAVIASRDVSKALRVEVTYKPDLQRPMALDWQRELIPALEPNAAGELRRIIAPLRYGDVLQVDYTPEKGTTVRVNKGVAVSRGNHDLMLAFLDHWIGPRPVSEEIKQVLVR